MFKYLGRRDTYLPIVGGSVERPRMTGRRLVIFCEQSYPSMMWTKGFVCTESLAVFTLSCWCYKDWLGRNNPLFLGGKDSFGRAVDILTLQYASIACLLQAYLFATNVRACCLPFQTLNSHSFVAGILELPLFEDASMCNPSNLLYQRPVPSRHPKTHVLPSRKHFCDILPKTSTHMWNGV